MLKILLIYLLIGIVYSLLATISKTVYGYKITTKGMRTLLGVVVEWPYDIYCIIRVLIMYYKNEITITDIREDLKDDWYKD